MSEIEQIFINAASGLRLIVEVSSVAVIGIGLVVALYLFVRTIISRQRIKYIRLRLVLGRFLVLALELQLAADIIGTAIAPNWDQISKLAVIALIRTFLNYFLNREIEVEEKRETEEMTKNNNNNNKQRTTLLTQLFVPSWKHFFLNRRLDND